MRQSCEQGDKTTENDRRILSNRYCCFVFATVSLRHVLCATTLCDMYCKRRICYYFHTYFTDNCKSFQHDSFFFREFLGSDHSQENVPVKSASLLFQFTFVMDLKTTNEEQTHLRRKVRVKGRNSEREQRQKKNNKSIIRYGNKRRRKKKLGKNIIRRRRHSKGGTRGRRCRKKGNKRQIGRRRMKGKTETYRRKQTI